SSERAAPKDRTKRQLSADSHPALSHRGVASLLKMSRRTRCLCRLTGNAGQIWLSELCWCFAASLITQTVTEEAMTVQSPARSSKPEERKQRMSGIFEVQHPLIANHLARLRDESTPPQEFRLLVQRLAVLLAYEATKDLELAPAHVQTPLAVTSGHV